MVEYRPARALSPKLRQECENGGLYSEELKSIVIVHENEVIRRRRDTARKVIRTDYETTKGIVRIHSFFTEDRELKYSHVKTLKNPCP